MKFSISFTIYIICVTCNENQVSAQSIGSSCIRQYDNSQGFCSTVKDCPQVLTEYRVNNIAPTYCARVRPVIICCPTTASQPNTSKTTSRTTSRPNKSSNLRVSVNKCLEYSKLVTATTFISSGVPNSNPLEIHSPICIFTNSLVVGGTEAKPGEFPHMAVLGWTVGDETSWNCGGSLISERYVLTAAHCGSNRGVKPDVVRLGEQNLKKLNDGAQEIEYKIAEVIKHPNYKSKIDYDDIALIKLIKNVVFNQFVRPACLWQSNNINDTKAIAIGFGITGYAEAQSDVLLKVGLDIIDKQDCKKYFDAGKIVDTQICAGVLAGGKDTCGGDSGGALQITTKTNLCVFHVIGVTSYGSSVCGAPNSPGVYTRVSSYLNWIESIVWN